MPRLGLVAEAKPGQAVAQRTLCAEYSMTLPAEKRLQNCEGVIIVSRALFRMHTEGAVTQDSSESPMISLNRERSGSGTMDAS